MISDQRYSFQSRLALGFLAECRRISGKDDGPLRMEQVINIFGRLLQADLFFLASLATAKEAGEEVHTIQPLADLSFERSGSDYSSLEGEVIGKFTLSSLKHYQNRKEEMPSPLSGKNMKRYLVCDRLILYYAQGEALEPEKSSGDFCLVFAWDGPFPGPPETEGQLYTTELFVLISELGSYVINKILLEIQCIKALSTIKQTTESIETYHDAQEQVVSIQDPETRQEDAYFSSNWRVMDVVDQMGKESIDALENFINMNLKQNDSTTRSSVMRTWEWLRWLVDNEGSPKDKDQIKELKDEFEKKDENGKTLEERLRQKIFNEYPTIMDA